MIKIYSTKNKNQSRVIIEIDEKNQEAFVKGCKDIAIQYFKQIKRKAPNDYGNFYGREKAGYNACLEILEKFKNDFELI